MIKRKHSACASSCSPAVIDRKKTELFKFMVKAWNFATTLMTPRLIFPDIGPIQINFWWREPRMLEIRQ